jgi:Rrf2 family protein
MVTLTAEYALRAIVCLARAGAGRTVLARDLAVEARIPPHYLAKVLATLTRVRLLVGTRGTHGGYRLQRPAHLIRLIEVVEPFDRRETRTMCLLRPDQECNDSDPCTAHAAWIKVRQSLDEFLENRTVADLAGLPSLDPVDATIGPTLPWPRER